MTKSSVLLCIFILIPTGTLNSLCFKLKLIASICKLFFLLWFYCNKSYYLQSSCKNQNLGLICDLSLHLSLHKNQTPSSIKLSPFLLSLFRITQYQLFPEIFQHIIKYYVFTSPMCLPFSEK